MGIIKQLQTGTYETENDSAIIFIEGKMQEDILSLGKLEIEGALKDILPLLAVASAHALVEAGDKEAVEAFVVTLVKSIESIKADKEDNQWKEN